MNKLLFAGLLAVTTVMSSIAVNASPSHACNKRNPKECGENALDAVELIRKVPEVLDGANRTFNNFREQRRQEEQRQRERRQYLEKFDQIIEEAPNAWEGRRRR